MLQFFQNILTAIDAMLLYPSLVREVSISPRKSFHDVLRASQPSLKSLGQEVAELFTSPLDPHRMSRMSARLQRRYLEKLQNSTECMLPSFNHTLPTGQERGTYLALDVGGSTLRVALVELSGKSRGVEGLKILQMSVSSINNVVRRLPGTQFFDWMAEKIANMLANCPQHNGSNPEPLPVGLSWSFPVEQTSCRGGKVQGMGKGFCCAQATIGQDLGELIVDACRGQGLNLRIDALINDSCATLLSRAYSEPSTSMSLILGTGTNMAIHLPVSCLGDSKLQGRDDEWLSQAERVTINTELSMFGKGILPETRWDDLLNRSHLLPNFQPLEYMTTGRYLGEILRLVIAEAVETAGLFDGRFPSSLEEPYSLDTALLAMIEEDQSPSCVKSGAYLQKALDLDLTPTAAEMAFLRIVIESISKRAAAYIAVTIHALWVVERKASKAMGPSKTTIACNGSVVEKYPGFRTRCQEYIAEIIECDTEEGFQESEVVLQMADEAAILGAAVAVAVGDGQP
jgi:hexokinase